MLLLVLMGTAQPYYPIRIVCYSPYTGEYAIPDSLKYHIKYLAYNIRTITANATRPPLGGLVSAFIKDTIDQDLSAYDNLGLDVVAYFHSGALKDSVCGTVELTGFMADDSLENAIADANKGNFKATGFSTHSAADVYNYFTNGANEDVFKANVSALALQSEVANLDGWNPATQDYTNEAQVWAYATRTLTSETWSTTQRDDLIAALADSAMRAKIWAAGVQYWVSTDGTFGDTLMDLLDAAVSTAGNVASISEADIGKMADTVKYRLIRMAVADLMGANTYYWDSLLVAAASAGSGSCAYGDGAYARYIVLLDSSAGDTTALNLAAVYANNSAQTGTAYYDLTDNTGKAWLQLNAGTWVIFSVAPGYQQIMDTITITGTGTDTLWTYTSAANKTTVYGTLFNPAGQPYPYAVVTFELKTSYSDTLTGSLITFQDSLIAQRVVTDTANASGYFSLPLYANGDLSDTASYYKAVFRDRYGSIIERPWYCEVTDTTTSIQFADLRRWR